jgi:hypothetical protein
MHDIACGIMIGIEILILNQLDISFKLRATSSYSLNEVRPNYSVRPRYLNVEF